MKHAYAVILAGGRGERFWPLSTSRRPKQLLALLGGQTLISMAAERLEGLIPPERILIITSRDLVDATRMAVPDLPANNVIGEPVGRDTAAACALACALVERRDPLGVFCILTADQVIGDVPLFQSTLREGFRTATENDVLITIGVKPAFASTGFGYIEAGEPFASHAGIDFLRARRFVEKPDASTAQAYLESGLYFWNSGMFIWSAASLRKAFAVHRPQLISLMDGAKNARDASAFQNVLAAEYAVMQRISVDYALMEKADNIVMARGVFAWDDVGTWAALENHLPAAARNAVVGQCETIDASGNVVYSAGRLTALIGVKDLIVVQAEGVTLICPKERAQDVKKMVQLLHSAGRYEDFL
jgi:mannose-1-phosphate guanylyltransferase